MAEQAVLRPVIREAVDQVLDRKSLSEGIRACESRRADFASELEMQLAGIAMVPEARQLMSDALTRYWASLSRASSGAIATSTEDFSGSEVVIGAGFHAAVYCANRVRTGFPRPVVLEQGSAEQVGGAFAMSLQPVFRLNSRSRPGLVGLPDQDKALNYLPGGLLQPSMMTSEEYPANADMAWLIRLTLAQYADVYPGIAVTGVTPPDAGAGNRVRLTTSAGDITPGRVIDARGLGTERDAGQAAQSDRMLTFSQLMARMGAMFPLRGMQQVAVIGSGDSARCAAESLLGIAPGHRSAIGLDYVQRVDLYSIAAAVDATCAEFRTAQRGRYIRLAQFLEGNVSNPSVRLRVISAQGFATPLPDGVLVNARTYDLAVLCTGSRRASLDDTSGSRLAYLPVQRAVGSTILATVARPFESYRIGPAADLPFTPAEEQAGISEIPANKVSMFRLAPRTAALALVLGAPETK